MSVPIHLPDRAKILIVRLRRIGDLLLLTPALRAIRDTYPQARIDVLVLDGFHHALVGNPRIDRPLILKRGAAEWLSAINACGRGGYDAVLDFQSSPRSLPFVVAAHAAVRVGWRKRGVRDWAYTHHAPGWDEPIYVARNFVRFASIIGVPVSADLHLELVLAAADRERAADTFAAITPL